MSTSNCRSVLYVDDDPDICEVVKASLGMIAGLAVHVANSGERAIDLAFELRPDLILMDVMMPGMDGPTTLKRLRASPLISDIPVIFLTAKILPTEVANFLQLGAIGVIGKPFDPVKLGGELFALWKTTDAALGVPGVPSGKSSAKEDVDLLTDGFLQRTRGNLVRLSELIELARTDRAALTELERISHSIHGAGAMFGFPLLSAAAGAIERLVEGAGHDATSTGAADHIATVLQLLDLTERLAQEVDAAEHGTASTDGLFQGRSAGRQDKIVAAACAEET
jgi:two-component system OmpR family response regulator